MARVVLVTVPPVGDAVESDLMLGKKATVAGGKVITGTRTSGSTYAKAISSGLVAVDQTATKRSFKVFNVPTTNMLASITCGLAGTGIQIGTSVTFSKTSLGGTITGSQSYVSQDYDNSLGYQTIITITGTYDSVNNEYFITAEFVKNTLGRAFSTMNGVSALYTTQ